MSTFSQIARFLRWRDWGPGKLTILWSLCLYIAVAYDVPFDKFAITFLVFIVFAATQSALGYVLNDWGDRELDRRQFKPNAFNGKSQLESTLALTLILVMAFVSGLPLVFRPGFAILWFAWVAAAAAYSIEPVRLKTRGAVGWVVSFVAQWFLPVLITFSAFEAAGGWDMWLIALALAISGATLEIAHQRYDRTRDLLTRAETFAAGLSDVRVDRIYAAALLLDKFAIGAVVGVAAYRIMHIDSPWAAWLAAALVALYGLLLVSCLPAALRAVAGKGIDDPYYGPRVGLPTRTRLLHETMLNFAVPVTLGVAANIHSPFYAFILGLFLVWRVLLGGVDWLYPLRAIRIRWVK